MLSSPPSPPPSRSHSVEIEHRLTVQEQRSDHITYRLSLHEKAILALAGAIYVLAQDKLPVIAAAIVSAVKP
jgi:hypothetical protein